MGSSGTASARPAPMVMAWPFVGGGKGLLMQRQVSRIGAFPPVSRVSIVPESGVDAYVSLGGSLVVGAVLGLVLAGAAPGELAAEALPEGIAVVRAAGDARFLVGRVD